ncbi:class I SAM-dependent methyltransferase [Mycobacterium sp. OTB74]|jgi:methyltransferase (TIGR00027 family)|uniref:class I SAM-dependent methyltransferase n=1 Tax=Mycobacterium sp. OTB74 TaxID=1853452 RepID=UPI00247609CE|nr:class I SAM-dependent methyltransferase [Mycobacterium sp. OTB74]MDH6242472.1 methyltransferase (TIGR00027 family) [Mycobacterium sp. OTB74]
MQRPKNDNWNLATSVGATATMVAAGRARATRADNALIDDPYAEPLVRAVGIDFFTRWATGELSAADVDVPGAPWGMQLMTDILTARTRYFDDFLSTATASGIEQVVILASGLDVRGYRMSWPTGTVIYEIDLPDVLSFKDRAMADLGVIPTAEVRHVPIDLRDDWPAALRAAGFDPARQSVWIAEGLMPFLPSDAQDRMLDQIGALAVAGSRLATEVSPTADDSADENGSQPVADRMSALAARWRDNGLDIEFGALGYPGPRNDVVDYLDARGWQSTPTPLRQLLIDAGLPELPDQPVFGDNYYCASVRMH